MLQTIRERAQGWIAWVIVFLISIPFALWGIQSYLGVGAESIVATVNGMDITQREFDRRYQDTRMRLRDRLGASYRPELFDEKTMRAQVLDAMIQENLLLQVSHGLGLRASDRELRGAIVGNPAFQKDGRFDKATYDRMLELQGTHGTQYEDGLRQRLVGTQLQRALAASALVSERELAEAVRLDRQQRQVAFIRIPKGVFVSAEPIAEADIEAHYQANEARFRSPERVKLSYLVLDAESIDQAQAPDEAELLRRYEEEGDRFRQPEQRRARHILVALDAGVGEQAETEAKARIESIRARIQAGEEFGTLAGELSEDPGSASNDGDLGLFGQGVMDPAFDEAVFALETGVLSEPVRSQFGYHLIEVTEIQPEHVAPFEEVRDQLDAEVVKSNAEALFYDWAERLSNLTFENPDSLEPAAENLGMELLSSDWIDRSGGLGILANPKVIAAAFSDDVLGEGLNSELIEPERNLLQAVVLRVIEHEEAAPKPLDIVRDDIVEALRIERAETQAKIAADAIVERLKSGEELSFSLEEYQAKDAGLIARDAPDVEAGVRELAFSLRRPTEGSASFGSGVAANGDAIVVTVSKVVDGVLAELDEPERDRLKRELEQRFGSSYFQQLMTDLKARASIERKVVADEAGF